MQRTSRTTVRRFPERAVYDIATIHAILDAGFVCHVGFMQDEQPFVIPTLYVRVGERVYLHGSPHSRLLRLTEGGLPLCLTVTHVDGLVLARSAFHHSLNYRSVMILGRGQIVVDQAEKEAALNALVEHIIPGRLATLRRSHAGELKATQVLVVPLEEASAKIRTGPPVEPEVDHALPIWAGELPLRVTALAPVADSHGASKLPIPEHLQRYRQQINVDRR
jgi:uncharacterized protein